MREAGSRAIFVAYAGLVAFISLRPMTTASIEPWDKLGHLIIYCIFAILANRVVVGKRHFQLLCLVIFLYSGLLELAQSLLPGRVMSGYDLLANGVGVLMGMLLVIGPINARDK